MLQRSWFDSRRQRLGWAALLLLFVSPTVRAQELDTRLWGVNGPVRSMARSGQTLYLAGDFSAIGPSTGGGVAIDRGSAALDSRFPHVAGRVTAAVPDGHGGWFIGGHFTHVGGVPRANLAHILANGQLADWAPAVVGEDSYVRDPDFEWRPAGVNTLLLLRRTLFVGGSFHTISGQARADIAALDAASGAVLPWNPGADGEVRCLGQREEVLYAGGDFAHVAGEVRNGLAALGTRTGRLRSWNPNAVIISPALPAPSRVRSLAISDRLIYVGGDFDAIGGQPRNSVAALDARTGRATSWDARLGPSRHYVAHGTWVWPMVSTVAVHKRSIYIGGSFWGAGGTVRPGLVALDTQAGDALPFDPELTEGAVLSLVVRDNTLYVAGALYHIGGAIRPNLAALDLRTGRATEWNPRVDAPVEMIAVRGRQLFVGGRFSSVHDWEPRTGLAAIDLATGRATSWAPRTNGRPRTIVVSGNRVFVEGSFSVVNDVSRLNLVALDGTTGALDTWDAGALGPPGLLSSSIYSLAVQGERLYVGGYFSSPGMQPRYSVAALDVNTAAVSDWAALLDGRATGVFPENDRVYVSGPFYHVGGVARTTIVALDPATATLLPWAPEFTAGCSALVEVLVRSGSTIYLGGTFYGVGGADRIDAAAVDAATAAVLPWDPQVDVGDSYVCNFPHVKALAMSGREVWVGGTFTSTRGQAVPYLAVVDDAVGELADFRPRCNGAVEALLASGDTMFVAGAFQQIGGQPQSGIAAFVLRTPASRGGAVPVFSRAGRLSMAPVVPNPVASQAMLRFTLPTTSVVDLAVYDIQGRLAAGLIAGQTLVAGPHEVALSTEAWRPGFYFCRLSAGGESRIQKVLVVR